MNSTRSAERKEHRNENLFSTEHFARGANRPRSHCGDAAGSGSPCYRASLAGAAGSGRGRDIRCVRSVARVVRSAGMRCEDSVIRETGFDSASVNASCGFEGRFHGRQRRFHYFAGVFSAVLASLPAVSNKMVVFRRVESAVVALSEKLADPVDVLFGTQLGGGPF